MAGALVRGNMIIRFAGRPPVRPIRNPPVRPIRNPSVHLPSHCDQVPLLICLTNMAWAVVCRVYYMLGPKEEPHAGTWL